MILGINLGFSTTSIPKNGYKRSEIGDVKCKAVVKVRISSATGLYREWFCFHTPGATQDVMFRPIYQTIHSP
jgi:hypothetical protein